MWVDKAWVDKQDIQAIRDKYDLKEVNPFEAGNSHASEIVKQINNELSHNKKENTQ